MSSSEMSQHPDDLDMEPHRQRRRRAAHRSVDHSGIIPVDGREETGSPLEAADCVPGLAAMPSTGHRTATSGRDLSRSKPRKRRYDGSAASTSTSVASSSAGSASSPASPSRSDTASAGYASGIDDAACGCSGEADTDNDYASRSTSPDSRAARLAAWDHFWYPYRPILSRTFDFSDSGNASTSRTRPVTRPPSLQLPIFPVFVTSPSSFATASSSSGSSSGGSSSSKSSYFPSSSQSPPSSCDESSSAPSSQASSTIKYDHDASLQVPHTFSFNPPEDTAQVLSKRTAGITPLQSALHLKKRKLSHRIRSFLVLRPPGPPLPGVDGAADIALIAKAPKWLKTATAELSRESRMSPSEWSWSGNETTAGKWTVSTLERQLKRQLKLIDDNEGEQLDRANAQPNTTKDGVVHISAGNGGAVSTKQLQTHIDSQDTTPPRPQPVPQHVLKAQLMAILRSRLGDNHKSANAPLRMKKFVVWNAWTRRSASLSPRLVVRSASPQSDNDAGERLPPATMKSDDLHQSDSLSAIETSGHRTDVAALLRSAQDQLPEALSPEEVAVQVPTPSTKMTSYQMAQSPSSLGLLGMPSVPYASANDTARPTSPTRQRLERDQRDNLAMTEHSPQPQPQFVSMADLVQSPRALPSVLPRPVLKDFEPSASVAETAKRHAPARPKLFRSPSTPDPPSSASPQHHHQQRRRSSIYSGTLRTTPHPASASPPSRETQHLHRHQLPASTKA